MISHRNKYTEWEKQLLENYKLWGMDNLDLIEVLDGLRELNNDRKQRLANPPSGETQQSE